MSYEGFTEYLCAKGHYFARDAYDSDPDKCPECSAPIEWCHGVDQTNGYDESHPSTCDAPRAILGRDDKWHKDHHGNDYATEVTRYCPAPGSKWRHRKTGQTFA